jgi:hypothetical protein
MGFAYPGSDKFKVVDLNLGWDKRHENPTGGFYWEAVRDAIIKPALEASYYHHRKSDKILLHGDRCTDEKFQKVLREVVERALENNPEIFELDPVFSAARGAAEMAKRVHWNYNQTNSNTGTMGNDL